MRGLKSPLSSWLTPKLYRPTAGDGCVLWYPGQDDAYSSTIRDRSGHGNHGIVVATWQKTPQGLCLLDFDGTDDNITTGTTTTFKWLHGALDTTAFQFTIELWVRNDDITSGAAHYLLGTGTAGSAGVGVDIYTVNRAIYCMIARGVAGETVLATVANTAYPNSTTAYTHLMFTYNQALANTNLIVYVNGVQAYTGNKSIYTPSTAVSAYALYMGTTGALGLDFDGRMALQRIYNRVLSAAEGLSHYQQERHLFGV